MSHSNHVKSPAHGGSEGSPPGAWSLLDSGQESVAQGTTVNAATLPYPAAGEVYLPIVTQADANGAIEVVPGSLVSAPPTTSLYYGFETGAGFVILALRAGATAGTTVINWAVYKVVLP